MIAASTIATTGLAAASLRLEAAAANVANVRTTGALPDGPDGARAPYAPVDVVQRDVTGGGVDARLTPRFPAYTPMADPGSPDANADGLVAAPNVDLATEMVDLLTARLTFEANPAVLGSSRDAVRALLDTIA